MAAITLNGTELRTSDGRLTTWIRKGLYGPPDYRGDTWVIAGKAGETVVAGSFVRARRMIELGQQIKGIGATEALAQVDFLATVDALKTLYESTMGAPKDLRVYAPLYGIGGSYRHLNVQWVNTIESDPIGGFQQIVTVRFACYDDPPEWVAV
jgi:hypothetical protein